MNKRSKKFRVQKTIALLVMLAISMLMFLDWFVDVGQYFPHRVHEFGHKVVMERKPGVQFCYYNHVPEAYQTTCIYEEGAITEFYKKLFDIAGYSLELLAAFLVILTPFSLIGGSWILRIQHAILFNNNNPSNDLYWLSWNWKVLIAVFLAFMFLLALILQNKWIDYGLKLKEKILKKRKRRIK